MKLERERESEAVNQWDTTPLTERLESRSLKNWSPFAKTTGFTGHLDWF